ncbi:hypothetical protein ACT3TI_08910 [Psychrobacter sp. AOP22-C1-22]|uniref:hypothetical protein n=2 Tax=unclassified Psychrobacter TaxID=196806 RepID=UPI001CE42B42|nr:hypothetical protein [Psychrobacter sp. FME6]MDN5801709.1 hypothetical protein [Psychrobacter sp.]
MLTTTPQYNKLSITMTSKPMQTSKDSQNLNDQSAAPQSDTSASSPSSKSSNLTIDSLIDAQVAFMQQWLRSQAEPLSIEAWHWFGEQPLSNYVSSDDLQHLINDWLLNQPMSEVMRADIRDILHTVIYHPVNDNVPLSELVDDTQVETLANYVGSHEQQRNILIHTLVGNDTFADLLTQTLYHAINDFMETTLDKAGGVGKLMKLGRSSFEKATNKNLDEKLQTYLHRNIKDLTRRAEANAQEHLSNEEVARLLVTGWARIKDQPISEIQTYLRDEPNDSSIEHIEASIQQSYNRLRLSPYLHSLVAASVDTWYSNHQSDSIAGVAASLNIDEQAMAQLNTTLLPVFYDALESPWLTAHITAMLQAFYTQPEIKQGLVFSND